ncbi:MAG: tyrosine recombinase XerS [Kurthia sp.]|nr:tyrosine recombinase XerS [Candidatus Kurthia equi]
MATLSPDDLKILEYTDNLAKELPFYIRDFRIEKTKEQLSFRSIHQYLYRYKIFFEWLQGEGIVEVPNIKQITLEQLAALRKKDIEYFIEHVSHEDISTKNENSSRVREMRSVSLMVSALKSLFHFLAVTSDDENGNTYLSENIMSKVKIPVYKETSANRAAEIATQILDSERLFDFIDYLANEDGYFATLTIPQSISLFKRDRERDIAIISILLATGMRVGELARITMADINYSQQTVKVIRKGNKKDTIYIMDSAFNHLLAYIAIRNTRYPQAEVCPFLFVTYRHPARAISIRTIQMFVEKYTESYFPNGVYPHKLRHSFSVAFIKNGGEMTILRDLLGHSSIETTSLYVNMANSDKVYALNALESYLNNRP